MSTNTQSPAPLFFVIDISQALIDSPEDGNAYQIIKKKFDAHFFSALILRAGGNKARAGRIAGLDRQTIRKKLKQLTLTTSSTTATTTSAQEYSQ